MEFVLFVIGFVVIVAVATLVFGGWFLVMMFKGIGRLFGLLPGGQPPAGQVGGRRPSGAVQIGPLPNQRTCHYQLCKASNDISARFCRRCGRQLAAPAHVDVRRAAAW